MHHCHAAREIQSATGLDGKSEHPTKPQPRCAAHCASNDIDVFPPTERQCQPNPATQDYTT